MLTSPWVYLAVAYTLSWAFTIPAALSRASLTESPLLMVVYALGGLGPAAAAIGLVYLTHDADARRDYWRRIVDPRRIGPAWYGVLFLLVPALTAMAALLDWALAGQGLELALAARWLEQPLLILPNLLFYLFFGPLPEEIGWRGYALDRLQDRRPALASSLILGVAWAMWHLPQFFVRGTYQHGLGFGSRAFWIFMFAIVANSVLYTWIYNNNRRSTLAAILFHLTINLTGELFDLSVRGETYLFFLTVAAAALVVLLWGPRTLARPARTEAS
jgi:membrane protease YdiL (CAAX protease family)